MTAAPPLPRTLTPSREATLGRIRLRHLQCFLAVAQFGNLRRAAQSLAITQPAVTKTLNELESLLGQALFVRGRKGAALTPAAEAFMRHAQASINALGQAVDSVLTGAEAPVLRIGVLPTVAASFMPQVLQAFATDWPAVGVRVTTGRNTQLLEALRSRELDAVIGRLSDPDLMAGLSFEHLYAEPVVIALRPGHPLPRNSAASAVAGYPWVLPLPATLIRQIADGFLAQHGIGAKPGAVETLDTSLGRALVLSGDNLWFTPLGAVQADIAAGLIARLDLALRPLEAVGLMRRTEVEANASTEALARAVRDRATAWRAASRI